MFRVLGEKWEIGFDLEDCLALCWFFYFCWMWEEGGLDTEFGAEEFVRKGTWI